ncbi:MAG: S46 family peptidase [Gemmatimonadales bacterium]|jgi:hypothetical protein
MRQRLAILPVLLFASIAAACTSSTPPPEVELTPAEAAPPRLAPPNDAVEMSRTVELNGNEMGTMWTFEGAPVERWADEYGFRASDDWLERVRLSSLRYGQFCSASFVSGSGLVMTNHHCARSCVTGVEKEGEDFLTNGFYAETEAEERTCPGLFLDQLVAISDVTERLTGGEADMAPAERAQAVEKLSGEIEDECEARSDHTCQVVSLYHGGRYMLYEYQRYPDVRLVFAPELQTGFYGGDPDNFTYPRYALDVSFVRAYGPDGEPVASPQHFGWDPDGAQEGEVVFVTGNPGSTSRQITVSQFMYERKIRHPLLLDFFNQRLEVLEAIADPQVKRQLANTIFSLSNSQKLFKGELEGLRSTGVLARKIRWQRELREKLDADPAAANRFTGLWDEIAGIQEEKADLYPQLVIDNTDNLFASEHLSLAALLNAWVQQMTLPEAERGAPFKGDAAEQTRQRILRTDPGASGLSAQMLAGRIAIARDWLAADDPLAAAARPGETPAQAARRLISSSKIGDADFRRRAMSLSPDSLAALGDPLVRLAAAVGAKGQAAGIAWQDVTGREDAASEKFAKAVFQAFGTDLPPDATFTLRITDGVVERYPYNGTFAPPHTTIYGLYARSAEFGNEDPWTLAPSWDAARDEVDMSAPLDFVSTNDITGGNSGSPVIDKDANVVGVAFDGNIESLPNEFLFGAPGGRTVSVHSAGILEALRSVYHADRLVEELTDR